MKKTSRCLVSILMAGMFFVVTPACDKEHDLNEGSTENNINNNSGISAAEQYQLEYSQYIARINGKFAELSQYPEGTMKDSIRKEIEELQLLAYDVRKRAAKEGITIKKDPAEDRSPW